MHLADTFIQSDLHCIQAIHFFPVMTIVLSIVPFLYELKVTEANKVRIMSNSCFFLLSCNCEGNTLQ